MLSFFPRDVLNEIWDLIGSVSEGLPTYFCIVQKRQMGDHADQKDLHLVCSQTYDMNMKQICFHHFHSISLN